MQLWHLHSNIETHSGQFNFTDLSLGIICLLQQLHTGNSILDDIIILAGISDLYLP